MSNEPPPGPDRALLTIRDNSTAWTQRVGGFAALPALIRELSADPAATLSSAGLDPGALDGSERRVAYAAFAKLFHEAAIRTGCGHFGLLAGRLWHLADLGVLGELVRNSATVGEGLHRLVDYQHLNSEGGVAFLLERASVVDLGFAIYHPHGPGADQIYEAYIAGGCNFLREVCGAGWRPTQVFFPRARPADVAPYLNLFKVQPRFDADFCALRFSSAWMRLPVEGADASRLRVALAQVEAAGKAGLLQQVYRALRVLLLDGKNSGDDVARALSLHRRTLNRRLKAEGTTFQHVLDEVRFEVARQLLSNPRIALDDIAAALGYSGVSQFMRTFKRWAGTTPDRWRRSIGTHPADVQARDEQVCGEQMHDEGEAASDRSTPA